MFNTFNWDNQKWWRFFTRDSWFLIFLIDICLDFRVVYLLVNTLSYENSGMTKLICIINEGAWYTTKERQKAVMQELMFVLKDLWHNTEVSVCSFMMLLQGLIHILKVQTQMPHLSVFWCIGTKCKLSSSSDSVAFI